jgi:dienelactone hydrolase
MDMKRSKLALLLSAILVVAVQSIAAQEVTIPSQTQFGEELQLPGILHKPSGDGPFPAVVMLCGCGGLKNASPIDVKHDSTWAERLVEWGYVALQLDSFSPRGPSAVCDNPGLVDDRMIGLDAFSAKSYLSTLLFVDPKKIAVIGWGNGAWAVLRIVDNLFRDENASPFNAAVAFYPYGHSLGQPDTPLLVLAGEKDDWCPAFLLNSLKRDYARTKYELSLIIYPNAYNAFDYERAEVLKFAGHHIEYDPEATSEAITRTKEFLAKYLEPIM